MEIALMNKIICAGITPFQDPSFSVPLGEFSEFLKLSSFWTWGAIVLAAIATFSSLLTKKVSFFRLGSASSPVTEPLIRLKGDPDDETCLISTGSESEDLPSTFELSTLVGDGDFRVLKPAESDKDRQKDFDLSLVKGSPALYRNEDHDACFSSGVVKLWNELGFGNERSRGLISTGDLNRGEVLRSFKASSSLLPAATMASPAVVLSAGLVGMSIWDRRVGSQVPVSVAEWQSRRGPVVGIGSCEAGKVYVRDHGGSVVVRDTRNLAAPLQEITESDEQAWFDTDAVMVGREEGMELDGDLTEKDCGTSAVGRCRKAMRSYLF